jgi:hypothetical protein
MNRHILSWVRGVISNKAVLAAVGGFAVAAASAVTANAQVNFKQIVAAGIVGAAGAVKLIYTAPPN